MDFARYISATTEGSTFGILLIYLIVVGVALYIDYLIANEFYNIARQKGYETKKYFWFCFWLGIVGYLMVIALPNLKTNIQPKEEKTGNEIMQNED